jgi:hypothetical protein
VASLAVLPLVACSVPREADVVESRSTADPPSASVSPSESPSTLIVEVRPATATPSASASPVASPKPTPVKPPVPPEVPGYTLGAAPRSVPNPMTGVKGAADVFGAMTVRSVSRKGAPVGLLFLFAVRPQYLDNSQVTKAVASRLATSVTKGGVPLHQQHFGRRTVSAGSSGKNGTIVLWCADGVLTVVVGGADPAVVTGFARALSAAS